MSAIIVHMHNHSSPFAPRSFAPTGQERERSALAEDFLTHAGEEGKRVRCDSAPRDHSNRKTVRLWCDRCRYPGCDTAPFRPKQRILENPASSPALVLERLPHDRRQPFFAPQRSNDRGVQQLGRRIVPGEHFPHFAIPWRLRHSNRVPDHPPSEVIDRTGQSAGKQPRRCPCRARRQFVPRHLRREH